MTAVPTDARFTAAQLAALERIEAAEAAPESWEKRVEVVAQAIRDSNGTPEALDWWSRHGQLVPAHVYAAAALTAMAPETDA
jgi:hypothetical protein